MMRYRRVRTLGRRHGLALVAVKLATKPSILLAKAEDLCLEKGVLSAKRDVFGAKASDVEVERRDARSLLAGLLEHTPEHLG